MKDNINLPTTQQLNDHVATMLASGDVLPSWRVWVIADNSGKWAGNGVRHATREAAESAARDLESRWFLVEKWRVTPSREEINRP